MELTASLQERFESVRQQVNTNRRLVHRGRYLTAHIKVFIGTAAYLVDIRNGEIHCINARPPLFAAADLVIRATEEAWAALWEKPPRPGWHDIFALAKRGAMGIEGDSRLFFAHLQYLKDVLSAPASAQ